jgi:cytochrome P450
VTTAFADLPVLDLELADKSVTGLHPRLKEMRAESPVCRVKFFGQDAVALLTYELVWAAFKDEETLPSGPSRQGSAKILGPHLSSLGGEEHRVKRGILAQPFRKRIIPKYLEMIEATANELIDEFVADGEADLVKQFTKRYPMRVISNMLGLPKGNDAEMMQMALDLLQFPWDPDIAYAAKQKYIDMVTPLIEERKRNPQDDLISFIVTTGFEDDRLDEEDVHGFVRHLFPAGSDTTYLGLGNTLRALLTQPELMEVARTQPEKRKAIVEEGLRWDAPVAMHPRMTNVDRDVDWHGYELPRATPMIFSIMSANRDPEAFADPEVFDPDRHSENPAMTFGFGTHFCVGSHLAIAEISSGLSALIDRLDDLRLADGAEPQVVGAILRGPADLPVAFTPSS